MHFPLICRNLKCLSIVQYQAGQQRNLSVQLTPGR